MVRIGRRQFTAGLGLSLLAAPWLRVLQGEAHAATADFARRLIVVFTPNGTVHHAWRPQGSQGSFTFPAGSILEPLERHRSRLLVCDGIDFHGVSNHEGGMGAMLTGGGGAQSVSGGQSVDQFLARRVGSGLRLQSLELGVQTSTWGAQRQTRMSYSAPGVFVSPEDSPRNAFQRMFGPLTSNTEVLLRRRQSVLDLVREELHELSQRVGREERPKLEQHMESLRQTERRLVGDGNTAPPTCTDPKAPPALDTYSPASLPAVGRAQMDLLVTALACGMTRVGSLQWTHTIAPQVFTWLGVAESHHELSHKGDSNTRGVADFVKCERWFSEQFAYLLDSLAARPDPETGGTLLDSTLVVWAKEMGDGRMHDCRSVPFVLAGGSRCYFRFGRYLRLGGAPHQKLLTSICHAMGVPVASFGDASKGSGPLDNLV